jgi:uncharacterized protein YjiS (DUF1127 family)
MSDRTWTLPFQTSSIPTGRGNTRIFGVVKQRQPPPLARPRSALAAIIAAWRRHRSRVRIATLDAHLLRDIGVTYAEAENEANKPFWRA